MAGIDKYLQIIKTGVYGRDIRNSIYRAIEQVYHDATVDQGNTDIEVSKARGVFETLYNRLDNMEQAVKEGVKFSEMESKLQALGSLSPKGTYASLAALNTGKPNGDSGTYITTDNKHWYFWNGSTWQDGGVYQSSSVSPFDTFAFVSGNNPVNFDNKTKTFNVPGLNTYTIQGKVYSLKTGNTSYPSSSSWIVIDTVTNKLKTNTNPTSSEIVIGSIFEPQTSEPYIYFNGYHTIDKFDNTIAKGVVKKTGNIIYTGSSNIVYDKKNKKLTYPKMNIKIGDITYPMEAGEFDITGPAGFIVFDTTDRTIRSGDVERKGDTLLGFYDNNREKIYLNTFSISEKVKKIACLGDSITEGVHANGWQWHRYIDKWCKNNGIESEIINLGIGGTLVSDAVGNKEKAFVRRLDEIPGDVDVIVVFGGTNDWGNNADLGSISDSGTNTFYGAYKHILNWAATWRPWAKVITLTPLKRYYAGSGTVWKNAQTEPNNKGNLLQDYVEAVKEVSAMYAVPCVDLHNESGLDPTNSVVREKYIWDGLHPTDVGNKRIYPLILDKLRPLLEYD